MPPNQSQAISVSQLLPSPINGNSLMTIGGITTWSPGAGVTVVPFSVTPIFTLGTDQSITLSGNVASSTALGIVKGLISRFNICQDPTGGRTFVWPSTFRGTGTIGSTLNKCNTQVFESFDGTTMQAVSPMVTNQ
jgi:hypothetical protein